MTEECMKEAGSMIRRRDKGSRRHQRVRDTRGALKMTEDMDTGYSDSNQEKCTRESGSKASDTAKAL